MQLLKGMLLSMLLSGIACADGVVEEYNENSGDNAQTTSPQQPAEYEAPSASNYTQVTGFYAGADIGLSNLKNKMSKSKNNGTETTRKNKKKNGFAGDIFCGYNFQMGRFILGLECLLGMESARPVTVIRDSEAANATNTTDLTTPGESTSLKRKYTFGFVPRFGYAIFGGLNAYVNFGTTFAKYAIKHNKKEEGSDPKSKSRNKGRASLLLGLGLEQNFGPLFVRAECNKIFKRNVATIGTTKVSADSYIVKLGAGYRF